jgi:hypothetical protein
MSNLPTEDMMQHASDPDMVLHWHLRNRHFPPVGFMFDVCKQAIDACNAGDWEQEIDTSGYAEHRRYGTNVPAWVIVDTYHLEPFIDEQEVIL